MSCFCPGLQMCGWRQEDGVLFLPTPLAPSSIFHSPFLIQQWFSGNSICPRWSGHSPVDERILEHFVIKKEITSYMMLVSGDCVPQRAEHASWRGRTAPLVTERSELPAPDYGTVFRHTWKTLTCRIANSGGRWRHFLLDSGATAQCELVFNCAV